MTLPLQRITLPICPGCGGVVGRDDEADCTCSGLAGATVTAEPTEFVPHQKLGEVERERDALVRSDGAADLLAHFRDERDQLQATLDALVGEEAVEAVARARWERVSTVEDWAEVRRSDSALARDHLLRAREDLEAALQAAKKQAGGGGE